MPTSNRLEKVICLIEELLSEQACQDEKDCCDLFSSYEIKIVPQLMNENRYMMTSILTQEQRYEDHAILN